MTIKVRVAGVFTGLPINEFFEEPYREGDTPMKVLVRLDKRKVLGRNVLRKLAKRGSATLLLNGDRLGNPEGLNERLKDGDEISVVSAIAGG